MPGIIEIIQGDARDVSDWDRVFVAFSDATRKVRVGELVLTNGIDGAVN